MRHAVKEALQAQAATDTACQLWEDLAAAYQQGGPPAVKTLVDARITGIRERSRQQTRPVDPGSAGSREEPLP
jgi:hypothetical protein